jgi:transcriptional regulator with XRE-family HTH domain
MGIVVKFRHALAPSRGYKSGRSSYRETPEIFSTANTRNGGTSFHCETACGLMPSRLASWPIPPDAAIARSSGFLSIGIDESTACRQNQVLLHCAPQAMLYRYGMQLKDRLKAALRRRGINQSRLMELLEAGGCRVSTQAVSQWMVGKTSPARDKMRILEQILKLPRGWLSDDNPEPLPPLGPDDDEIFLMRLMALGKRVPPAQREPTLRVVGSLLPDEPKPAKTRQRAS